MLTDILKDNKCFKLICGAGNEDVDEIEKLTALYSQAGCSFFDICANEKVIDAAKRGLKRVGKENSAYLCISVGVESDQHFCKAQIDEQNCIKCGQCKDLCLQQAIEISENKSEVNTKKCIGCKKCVEICPQECISLVQKPTDLEELLPPLIAKGLDCIELHVAGNDDEDYFNRWKQINEMFTGILSISINRSVLGDEKLIDTGLMLCDRMIILIGSSQECGTERNPFNIATRKDMLESIYGGESNIMIYGIALSI